MAPIKGSTTATSTSRTHVAPGKTRVLLHLGEDVARRLRIAAAEQHVPRSTLADRALRAFLDAQPRTAGEGASGMPRLAIEQDDDT